MDKNKMGLYLHIPYCVKKCDYCDFLSFSGGVKQQDAYAEALLTEIGHTDLKKGTKINTIFIGGGTPSVIDSEWIVCFLEAAKSRFEVEEDAEITLEANPGTLTQEKLSNYRRVGVNRLSLGLQSANDRELQELGRIHTYEGFVESYQMARKAGFSNINIDLMMAIPGQDRQSFRETLKKTVALRPDHLSVYSLIVEEGTSFYERRDKLVLPGEEEERQMYEESVSYLREWGYEQYEISNFARPGRQCRHNIGCWSRTPYLGMGLGASSLVGEERFLNTRDMEEYLAGCQNPESLRRERETLSTESQMEEFLFLGLRMTQGVSKERFFQCFGRDMDEVYGPVIRRHCENGLLQDRDGRLSLTAAGISLSNTVMADFLLR